MTSPHLPISPSPYPASYPSANLLSYALRDKSTFDGLGRFFSFKRLEKSLQITDVLSIYRNYTIKTIYSSLSPRIKAAREP